MIDSDCNPYRPPVEASPGETPPPSSSLTDSVVGSAMVLLTALALWTISVKLFDGIVPHRFEMWLWSLSLMLSLCGAAYMVARTRRFRPRLAHVATIAIVGIAAYAWLEGRAPGAGTQAHAILFYATAIASPVVLVLTTFLTPKSRAAVHRGG